MTTKYHLENVRGWNLYVGGELGSTTQAHVIPPKAKIEITEEQAAEVGTDLAYHVKRGSLKVVKGA